MLTISEEDEDMDEDASWVPAENQVEQRIDFEELFASTSERVGLAAMMHANPNGICMAKADAVRKVSVQFLLQQGLRIPVFQRRYCWHQEQWQLLWDAAYAIATGAKTSHSLGRLTCAVGNSDGGRILVVDGQQRNTTCTLLLAALRDLAMEKEEEERRQLATRLETAFFPDSDAMQTWVATRMTTDGIVMKEGESLAFASLVPTYNDRAAYFAAMLAPSLRADATDAWRRPLEAKEFFLQQLREKKVESMQQLEAMADAVLHKLEWLYFPIDMSTGATDGTENLQVIFERLAVREAMWIKPMMKNREEAADMGAADFVRNLLLSSFREESAAIEAYHRHWLPMERSIMSQNGGPSSLEVLLGEFLKEQPEKVPPLPAELLHVPVGGQLYPRFRRWLATVVATTKASAPDVAALADSAEVQGHTEAAMKRLAEFAVAAQNKGTGSEEGSTTNSC